MNKKWLRHASQSLNENTITWVLSGRGASLILTSHPFKLSAMPTSLWIRLRAQLLPYSQGLLFTIMLWAGFAVAKAQEAEIIVQSGHSDNIQSQVWDVKNNMLITGGFDGRIVIWDIDKTVQVGTINAGISKLTCLAISADGKWLAAGGIDKNIVLIDFASRKVVQKWRPFQYAVNDLAFSPDSKYLVAGSSDKTVWACQLAQRTISSEKGEDDIYSVCISPDNKHIYAGCRSGDIYKIPLSSVGNKAGWQSILHSEEQITAMSLSPNGQYLAFGTSGGYKNDVPYDGHLSVLDLQQNAKMLFDTADFSNSIGSHYHYIQWWSDTLFYYFNKGDTLKTCQWSIGQITSTNQSENLSFSLQPQLNWISLSKTTEPALYRPSQSLPSKSFKGYTVAPQRIWMNEQQHLMVEYANGFKEWNLQLGKMQSVEDKLEPKKDGGFIVSHNGKLTVRKNVRFGALMHETGAINDGDDAVLQELMGTDVTSLRFSPHDTYLVAMTSGKEVFIYKLDSGYDARYRFQIPSAENDFTEVPDIVFSPTEQHVAILAKKVILINLQNGDAATLDADRNALQDDLAAVFSPDGKYLITAAHAIHSQEEVPADTSNLEITFVPGGTMQPDPFYLIQEPGRLLYWNLVEQKMEKTIILPFANGNFCDATAFMFAATGDSLFVGTSDNRLLVLGKHGQLLQEITDHNDMVKWIGVLKGKHPYIITSSNDGTIKLRDPQTLQGIVTLFALNNHGYIIVDSSNHYKRSKSGTQAVLFYKNGQVYQPVQYDLYFNQPHRVLQAIGLASDELIALHKELYDRSLKAAGIQSNASELSPTLSVSVVNEASIEPVTSSKLLPLQVSIRATSAAAKKLMVFVNGTPVINGSAGIDILIAPGNSAIQNINVPLARGKNLVTLKAVDANGISSFEKRLNIQYQPTEINRANLYVITVSVSNYKDSALNLRYAVKDGKDFMSVWKKDGKKRLGFPSQFGKIFDYTFYDNNATAANIMSLKDTLKMAKEEDMVILYFSGHGMLDDNKDFWYATWDIDARNPGANGLSYSQMQNLLDSIAPVRKLLLLDACHSGEVDKSELTEVAGGGVQSGARSSIKKFKYKQDPSLPEMGNMFEMMQEMFNSFNKGTGTVVISAAAGDSYALESEQWNNGVFTYSLINGLISKAADLNKDGDISIAELSNYVSKQVSLLTNGQQKPTERQENTENNFRIW